MNRKDFFYKHLINLRNRKGTNVPLVSRDPYNYIFQEQTQIKNKENNSFTIEEILQNDISAHHFINNEAIKNIITKCKRKLSHNRSMSCSQIVKLPHLELKSKKSFTDGSSESNEISKLPEVIERKSKNVSVSPSRNITKTPIKQRLRPNQSQSCMITKSEQKRLFKLNSGVKIKSFYCRTRAGESNLTLNSLTKALTKKNQQNDGIANTNKTKITVNKISNLNNKDCYLAKQDITSKILGKISLFGVFNGNGEYGTQISKAIKNYLLDYFENSTNIQTCLKKDNYYTILTNAFISAQNYIKSTLSQKYDCNFSGTTSLLLFCPDDSSHKIYCANSGNSKCVVYSFTSNIPLSYEHYPSVPSERARLIQNSASIPIDTEEINTTTKRLPWKESELGFFPLSRVLGNFFWEGTGITAEPEIIECNLNKEDAKFIVIGTDGLWKYLSSEQAGQIVMRYYDEGNTFGACRELEETSRMRWRKYGKEIDDITAIVIFLHWENYKL